jgi:hypothetical protein
MPNQPKTPLRAFRIPDHEYFPAQAEAKRQGVTVTDVVRAALRDFGGTTEPGSDEAEPQRRDSV